MSHVGSHCKALAAGCGLISIAVAPAACRKTEPIPTEEVLVAKAAVAPGIHERKANMPANRLAYRGEVYLARARFADFQWQGQVEGAAEQRVGAIEASRSASDGSVFVFGSDFIDAQVPTSAWLCSKMKVPALLSATCPQTLRRTVATQGKLASYVTCATPDCPLAELSDGSVTTTTIPGMSDARVVYLGQQQVILAWSRWVRSVDWTGGSLIVMLVSPPLARIGEVPLEEIDAREAAHVTTRMGTLRILDDSLRFTGRGAVIDRQSAKELSSTTFDERYSVTPDGKFVKP